ncbi:hypothetical protein LX16_4310 [Stackebrandtia albiflava]|uniref:Uncharacterized protein n=1 Tax=Stackebrandtia albiflava TaxID=406432 RepID=A0A562UR48_9ACTN|nr:hypothetical protein [Stackebrandtia albiflava]TWJ08090.1 hypothetical protein LX16_4310 [Stackebrandtia albiflava]
MPDFQERLNSLKVTVTSPDNQIKAHLVAGEQLTLAFRPNTYERYDEDRLSDQLAKLATLAWVGYRRGWKQAKADTRGVPVSEVEEQHWDARYRRYDEDIANLVAQGSSRSGLIQLRSKGLAYWKVRIAPGTLRQLDEPAFVRETVGAFAALQRDSKMKTTVLKDRHFGLNLPPEVRAQFPVLEMEY